MADVVGVILDAREQPLFFKVGDDFLARDVAIEAGVGTAFGVDVRGFVHDVDGWQMVALAQGKVVGVVGGCDFHCAGAKFAADPFVQNDWNLAIHQRQAQLLAVEVRVALVFRMDGYGDVAEHGLGPGGGDGEILAGFAACVVMHRVADLPQVCPCARRRRLRHR